MTVRYDGTAYHGWQEQPGLATVQGTLVEVLATILGERPAVEGTSRTDAGVHAMGQVATVRTERGIEVARLQAALNSRLPADIAVVEMAEAPPLFRPSRDAAGKHYRYRIYRGPIKPVFEERFVWHWHRPLEAEPMRGAARLLTGRYDFKSFQTGGSLRENTVREIFRFDVTEAGPELHIDVEGDGFLYRMVRNLVGTLTEVGRGHRTPEWVTRVRKAKDRAAAGPCAPAKGLCLMEVRYE